MSTTTTLTPRTTVARRPGLMGQPGRRPRVIGTGAETAGTAAARTGDLPGVDLMGPGTTLPRRRVPAVELDGRNAWSFTPAAAAVSCRAVVAGLYAEEWVSEIGPAIRAEIPLSVLVGLIPASRHTARPPSRPPGELSGASEEGISHE
ncbi:MAG TPA: hypothetical protein VGP70_11950 [Actinomadura sp.]|nr:hypothetical protein [Actinomadura sp.]